MPGWPCCEHCQACAEDEPLHGEPCEEPGCQQDRAVTA